MILPIEAVFGGADVPPEILLLDRIVLRRIARVADAIDAGDEGAILLDVIA